MPFDIVEILTTSGKTWVRAWMRCEINGLLQLQWWRLINFENEAVKAAKAGKVNHANISRSSIA